jgi:tRNA-Thr(GGU) m(6)t(6)A37 methyltransferase TsaA
MSRETYKVSPIGRVSVRDDGFRLELDKQYIPALRELDEFSHVLVLWWCHRLDNEEIRALTQFDRPYKRAPAKMGVFATRSPARPNPIAATVVPLLKVDHKTGTIRIAYIDAEDGSPVADIKPYHPCTDRVKEVSVPAWCRHWPEWYEDSAEFNWGDELVNAQ